jgi:hypothetical protein
MGASRGRISSMGPKLRKKYLKVYNRLLKKDPAITRQKSLYNLMASIFDLILFLVSLIFWGEETYLKMIRTIKDTIILKNSSPQKSLINPKGYRITSKIFVME